MQSNPSSPVPPGALPLLRVAEALLRPSPNEEDPAPRRILVGLSGGADSVALLLTLNALRDRIPDLAIKGVHCNFNLRGEESRADEEFCIALCRRLGIELDVVSFDTEAFRRANRLSLEEACRNLRYDHFHSLMRKEGWERTAVAHHADDNAETFLLNLMRGAGAGGLRGMEPDNGTILRPFLAVSRDQILTALEEWGETYRTDSSNLSSDYTRNFLRNELIPLLETRFPHARRSINRTIGNLRSEDRLLGDLAEKSLGIKISGMPGGETRECDMRLSREALLQVSEPLTLLLRWLKPYAPPVAIATEIVDRVRQEAESGRLWKLNDRWRVSLERDYLEVLPTSVNPIVVKEEKLELTPSLLEEIKRERNPRVAYFPKPLSQYRLRPPGRGDRIRGFGASGSTPVSKLLKDARLSRRQKKSLLLLCDPETDRILWIPGVRRGEGERIEAGAGEIWRFSLNQ